MDARRVPVAVNAETEAEVCLNLVHSSVLVGGTSRGGKSTLLASLLASCSYVSSCALCVIDLKRVDYIGFTPRLSAYAKDVDTARLLLELLVDEMRRRYVLMEYWQISKIEQFDSSLPLIIVVIDELAYLMNAENKTDRESLTASLITLQQTGMAAGITLVAATQKPSADALGKGSTTFRDNFQQRVAFRTMTAEQSKTIGVPGENAKPEEIPPYAKGYCWISSECELNSVLAKALMITPEEIERVVLETQNYRVTLPFLPDVVSGASAPDVGRLS